MIAYASFNPVGPRRSDDAVGDVASWLWQIGGKAEIRAAGADPSCREAKAEHILDYEPLHCRVTYRQTFRVPSSPRVHVFGLWEEDGELGENPHQHRGRTLHEDCPHAPCHRPGIQTHNLLLAMSQWS